MNAEFFKQDDTTWLTIVIPENAHARLTHGSLITDFTIFNPPRELLLALEAAVEEALE